MAKEREIFKGRVIAGQKLGRKLGFATANIAIPDAADVVNGVYAGKVVVGSEVYGALINLGRRPSVGGGERLLEAHLLGFERDLYGREVEVELLKFVRKERKFDSLNELKEQIADDKEKIIEILNQIS